MRAASRLGRQSGPDLQIPGSMLPHRPGMIGATNALQDTRTVAFRTLQTTPEAGS
jgi:hypothetical protein